MKTDLWGPSAWKFLHAASFSYPDNPSAEKREAARELFRSLKFMLPCEECSSHYCCEYDKDPVDNHLDSRYDLSSWLVNFHNKVNERLGKKVMDYEDAKALYDSETCSKTCHPSPKSNLFLIFVLILSALFFIKLING